VPAVGVYDRIIVAWLSTADWLWPNRNVLRTEAHERPGWTDRVRHGRRIGYRIGDRHRAVTGRGEVMLCDIEEEALAKAVADLKLTNADVDGV
jgi:hypothetical protein